MYYVMLNNEYAKCTVYPFFVIGPIHRKWKDLQSIIFVLLVMLSDWVIHREGVQQHQREGERSPEVTADKGCYPVLPFHGRYYNNTVEGVEGVSAQGVLCCRHSRGY